MATVRDILITSCLQSYPEAVQSRDVSHLSSAWSRRLLLHKHSCHCHIEIVKSTNYQSVIVQTFITADSLHVLVCEAHKVRVSSLAPPLGTSVAAAIFFVKVLKVLSVKFMFQCRDVGGIRMAQAVPVQAFEEWMCL